MPEINSKYRERISNNFKVKYGLDIDVDDFFNNGQCNPNSSFYNEKDAKCLCDHAIKNCFLVSYHYDQYIMGSCCIKRFSIQEKKKCKNCTREYTGNNLKIRRTNEYNSLLCKECRDNVKFAIDYEMEFGKYKNNNLENIYVIDYNYFNWLHDNFPLMTPMLTLVNRYKQNRFFHRIVNNND